MTWLRRNLGLDVFDVLIQAGVTIMAIAFVAMSGGPEELMPVVTGVSLIVLALRRRRALRLDGGEREGLTTGQMAAARLEELEQRMGDLESAQGRILELEERLDFTERLLARTTGERAALPDSR